VGRRPRHRPRGVTGRKESPRKLVAESNRHQRSQRAAPEKLYDKKTKNSTKRNDDRGTEAGTPPVESSTVNWDKKGQCYRRTKRQTGTECPANTRGGERQPDRENLVARGKKGRDRKPSSSKGGRENYASNGSQPNAGGKNDPRKTFTAWGVSGEKDGQGSTSPKTQNSKDPKAKGTKNSADIGGRSHGLGKQRPLRRKSNKGIRGGKTTSERQENFHKQPRSATPVKAAHSPKRQFYETTATLQKKKKGKTCSV